MNHETENVVHEAEEDGYRAEVPVIPGCAIQGETFEDLLKNHYEAVEAAMSVAIRHIDRFTRSYLRCIREVSMAQSHDLQDVIFDRGYVRGTRPSVSYLVCSTPRCGSTLLSEGMWSSNSMGIPMEYFNKVFVPLLSSRWESGSLSGYLQDLVARRTDRTGAFGIKTHWAQLVHFHAEYRREQGLPSLSLVNSEIVCREYGRFLSDAFPGTCYIHITRLNRIRQAVSWYVGSLSGEWALREGQEVSQKRTFVPYNFDALLRYLLALDAAEACWREFFRINGITPITIVYEELEKHYEEGMKNLMAAVDLPPVDVPAPQLKRQADETTELLVRQMARDLNQAAVTL